MHNRHVQFYLKRLFDLCDDMKNWIGWVALRMEYFFLILPITCSTCILMLAILLVCSISMPESLLHPKVNAGVWQLHSKYPLNRLCQSLGSANIVSPGTILVKGELIACPTTPTFWYVTHNSLWSYANEILYGIMVFVLWVCLSSDKQVGRVIYKWRVWEPEWAKPYLGIIELFQLN